MRLFDILPLNLPISTNLSMPNGVFIEIFLIDLSLGEIEIELYAKVFGKVQGMHME